MALVELSLVELKALWYDQFEARAKIDSNLALINNEILARTGNDEEKVEPPED